MSQYMIKPIPEKIEITAYIELCARRLAEHIANKVQVAKNYRA